MKQFGDFRLDVENECLWQGTVQLPLRPRPFAVLRYLVEHSGRLVTYDELLDALWPNTYVQQQILRTYTQDLRRLLGDEAGQPRFIQTLAKRGYCFIAVVTEWTGPSKEIVPALDAARAIRHDAGACLGRSRELERLGEVWKELGVGQRRMVFVAGEIGIGKSALADAFLASVGAEKGVMVARGQCIEGFGTSHEYYPLAEAIASLCNSEAGQWVCEVVHKVAPGWLDLLSRRPGSGPPRGQPSTEGVLQQRLPGQLCEAFEEVARAAALIVLLEDLHWADASTLHLVAALARRRAPVRLLVVATYRPYQQDMRRIEAQGEMRSERHLKSMTQDLLLHRLAEEISLEPLGKVAVRAMCEQELGGGIISQSVVSFLHQRSGGNPLFLLALLEHMVAQSMVVQQVRSGISEWVTAGDALEMERLVPSRLEEMIELEIDRLAPEERCLLEAGSLMSVAFPAWAVAAALEKDAMECEEACDRVAGRFAFLERLGVEELPDGRQSAFYGFTHELYRDVLYHKQSHARRARRHTRVAERLGELFRGREADVAEELAYHYEVGEQWERAAAALGLAARHAREQLAWQQARALERRAAGLLERARGARAHLGAPEDASSEEWESGSDCAAGERKRALNR